MNPQVLMALEKIKTGDLKSAMDQLRFLCGQISALQTDVENVYTELDGKVSLQSRMQDGALTVSRLGSGIIASVTNTGTTLNGSGTFFSKECAVGNQIKIGAETTTITGFDSTTPDLILTVSPALTGTYINSIYAIIKSATAESLNGDYTFGTLNGSDTSGSLFHGVVQKDSTFELRGRMSGPDDAVSVKFVQKAVNPVMVRAQNAIQRNGDNITGPTTGNRYVYSFNYTDFAFGPYSNLTYSGVFTGDPDQLVTRGYVDNQNAATIDYAYANWNYNSDVGHHNVITPSGTSAGVRCAFRTGVAPDEYSSNFADYFTITSLGIQLNPTLLLPTGHGILVSISANADWTDNIGNDAYLANCVIYKNGTLIAKGSTYQDYAGSAHEVAAASTSATIGLIKSDYLVVGCIPGATDVNLSLSIAKIGLYKL